MVKTQFLFLLIKIILNNDNLIKLYIVWKIGEYFEEIQLFLLFKFKVN